MDSFNKGFTSSVSIKPSSVTNSPIHGNDENEPSQEMASKLQIDNKKRFPTKNFMSTTVSSASKAAVPKKKILVDRNETLDVEEQPRLSRSLSFDSKASRLPVVDADEDDVVDSSLKPYDPIKNYLSPRPRFLRYNPDRLRKISVRQESVTRVRRNASFDAGMPSSGEELESNADISSGACSPEESVEQVEEMIDKAVGEDEDVDVDEDEDENEEEFDEFEEDEYGDRSSNVLLKYFLVMIAVILTALAIPSMNSPTLLPARKAAYRDFGLNFSGVGGRAFDPTVQTDLIVGNLNKREIDYGYEWDKKGLVETTDELVDAHHGRIEEEEGSDHGNIKEEEEEGSDQLEGLETAEEINEAENREECSYELQDPMIPLIHISEVIESYKIEAEKEIYDRNDVIEESEIVKKMIEEDVVGEEEERSNNNNGVDENQIQDAETTDLLIGSASFDPIFAVSIGISVLILASSVIYFSKKIKASTPVKTTIAHKISTEIKNLKPSANRSSFIHKTHEEQIVNLTEKEVLKETSYVHAPTVELLSEFMIGGEDVSSSLRSCGMKDSNMLAEADKSSFSRSHGKNNSSLIQTDAVSSSQATSSHLELSTAESPSYGSFTAEKKIIKQRNKKAEVTPSPVRRSSRIHNRSITSP